MAPCRGVVTERGVAGNDMNKLGDDLIQSLKEAVIHAKGEGPGTEHPPVGARCPDGGDAQAQTDDVIDEID